MNSYETIQRELSEPCCNCSDFSGWVKDSSSWVHCGYCNPDQLKQKPPICICGRTQPFCACAEFRPVLLAKGQIFLVENDSAVRQVHEDWDGTGFLVSIEIGGAKRDDYPGVVELSPGAYERFGYCPFYQMPPDQYDGFMWPIERMTIEEFKNRYPDHPFNDDIG